MTGEVLFKKMLETGRIVIFIQTDAEEVTMAAYYPGQSEMTETLESIQRQAKAVGKLVVLDLSLMSQKDFEDIKPQQEILE